MDIAIIVLLAVVGVVLLVMEVFLLPGVGVAGVGGMLCAIGAVVYAYMVAGNVAGHITLLSILVANIILLIAFMRSKSIEKMGLKAEIDEQVQLADPGKKIKDLKRAADKIDAARAKEEKKEQNGQEE